LLQISVLLLEQLPATVIQREVDLLES